MYWKPSKKKTERQKKIGHADDWFSRWVRLEESNENGIGQCFCCGKPIEAKYNDCGHFESRRHMATRWDRINCHLQSKDCNAKMGDPEVNERYRKALIRKYGDKVVENLRIKSRNTMKVDNFTLDLIISESKQKVKELMKTKNFKTWW